MEKDDIIELTKEVLYKFDKAFPVQDFKPCSQFQFQSIDPASNWQIPPDTFDRLPNLAKLIESFGEIFPYLTVAEV